MELEFEDRLDEEKIFLNGIDGRPCHRESYNTTMDFGRMKAFLEKVKDEYTLIEWRTLLNHFRSISYLSPMNGLTAIMIQNVVLLK